MLQQHPRRRQEARLALRIQQHRVRHRDQRQHLARPRRPRRKLRVPRQRTLDRLRIARRAGHAEVAHEHLRVRLHRAPRQPPRRRLTVVDPPVPTQHPFGAVRRLPLHRALQLRPRSEPMLTRQYKLRIAQPQRIRRRHRGLSQRRQHLAKPRKRSTIAAARIAQQLFGLFFQKGKIRGRGKVRHIASMQGCAEDPQTGCTGAS